ncbi:MAG: hypothetical protein ACRERC_21680 [Candidatus Binatia bacterium]
MMLAGLALFAARSVVQAELARRGGEFLINTVRDGDLRQPHIAALPDGGFTVAWGSLDQIAARRFDAATQPLGPEFQVNSRGTCYKIDPSLAAAADGSLLVAWCAVNALGDRFIDAQRLDASVRPQGPNFILADDFYVGPNLAAVNVAAVGDDQFVVAWTGYGGPGQPPIIGQACLVGPSGQTPSFDLTSGVNQYNVAAAGKGDGSYQVVWYDGGGLIQGRPFQGAQPAANMVEIGRVSSGLVNGPALCTQDDGGFVVSWATYGIDPYNVPVTYRRYDTSGAPLAMPMPITPEKPDALQVLPAVTCGPKDFTVAWKEGAGSSFPYATYRGRTFTPDALLPFSDFAVGIQRPAFSGAPSIGRLADGDLLLAWHDCGLESGCGIFGQRFTFAGTTDCPGDCRRDGTVTINELILAVTIALDPQQVASMKACLPADVNLDYRVGVDELVLATGRALGGCQ